MTTLPEPAGEPAPVFEVALAGARAAFSTRLGGVSDGPFESLNLGILTDDDPQRVRENRRRLAATLGLDADSVALGVQVHGTDVRDWAQAPPPVEAEHGELPEVDGHTTARRELALMVLGADCLPVALASRDRISMLHCGWRGLAAGIVERAVAGHEEPPEAAIGPGVGGCCYEVGAEVLDAFADLDGVAGPETRPGHGMLDLPAVARRKLEQAGVAAIEHVDRCTSCRPDLFFSHRRDEGRTGRQCGIVWRYP